MLNKIKGGIICFKRAHHINSSASKLIYQFSTSESNSEDKKIIKDAVIRSNTVAKQALKYYLRGQDLVSLNASDDSLRVNSICCQIIIF